MRRSVKLFSVFFILMMFSIVSPSFTSGLDEKNPMSDDSFETNGLVGAPIVADYNASITQANRNVTIGPTGNVKLTDEITLKIHDNATFISSVNYTLPTEFAQYIDQVSFFVKRKNSVGLDNNEKYRQDFTKYIGREETTFTFSVLQNGTLANETESVHIYVELEALGAIKFEGIRYYQQGTFVAPVLPIFNNLRMDTNLVGFNVATSLDKFNTTAMSTIQYNERSFPRSIGFQALEWVNITRDAFNPENGLVKDYDYTTVVIFSQTPPPSADSTGQTDAIVPFVISNAERDLKIDPWGYVYVAEKITILHTGAPKSDEVENINLVHQVLGYSVGLDKSAKVTALYDEFGKLNIGRLEDNQPTTVLVEDKQVLNIDFRNGLYGGDSYTFTLEYYFNATDVISVEKNAIGSANLYSLNATLFSTFNTTVYRMKTTYELPAGATLESSGFRSISPKSTYQIQTVKSRDTLSFFNHVQLEIIGEDVSFVDNNQFVIQYTYNGLGHFQYIFTMILSLIGLLFVVLGISKMKISESPELGEDREKLPVEEIDTFLKYFTEHNDAYNTIADLAAKRRKNKISQKDYSATVKSIRKRIRDNSRKLEESIKDLSLQGGRYDRLVSKIMVSSEKINGIRTNISSKRSAYAKKQIAKDIYQQTIREYRIELDKHKSVINKSISELNDVINLE